MRTILFLVVTAIIAFSSCDEATINIATDFSKNITAESAMPSSAQPVSLKTTAVNPSFEVIDTLDLSDNDDLEEYMDKIQEIDIHTVSCTFYNIPNGGVIKIFTISIEGTEMSYTLENISINGTEQALSIATAILTAVGNELKDQERIIIKIAGTTSVPMTFTVKASFDSQVKVKALDAV